MEVPPVLLSGDHAAIVAWREREALRATLRKRPDLLHDAALSERRRRVLEGLRGESATEPADSSQIEETEGLASRRLDTDN